MNGCRILLITDRIPAPQPLAGAALDCFLIQRPPGGTGPRASLQPLVDGRGVALTVTAQHGRGVCLKLAFRYALEHDYDVVAYAPGGNAPLPPAAQEWLAPLARGELAAVYLHPPVELAGSSWPRRWLLPPGPARVEPAWRLLATASLRHLPYGSNGADDIFDAELDVQLLLSGRPLHYQAVAGLAPAAPPATWNLAKALLRYRCHRLGILYQFNYDVQRQQPAYTQKLGYASSHQLALDRVRQGSAVLDLGSGQDAYLAGPLKAKGCRVYAADVRPIANPDVDYAYCLDLNRDPLPAVVGQVDTILMLDVIEHLSDPEQMMLELRRLLSYERATVILTTPNVGFIVTRLMLLLGQFNYGKSGILDRTHCRLFTFRSLRRLLRQCGYVVEECQGIPAPFPKALGPGPAADLLLRANLLLIRLWHTLFSYQMLVRLRADPTLDALVRQDGGPPPPA